MGFFSNLFSGAQDMFGGAGSGGLLGALMSGYGASQMSQPSFDKDYFAQLQSQLNPLQQSYEKFGEMASQYEDPNSALNQQMRRDIRSQNLEGFIDVAKRERNKATGEYGSYAEKALDRSLVSDAMSSALRSHSQGTGDRMRTAAGLYGQQSQLANILAQAGIQNRLLAGQQAQFMPQYLAQTGMGLLNRAMYPA